MATEDSSILIVPRDDEEIQSECFVETLMTHIYDHHLTPVYMCFCGSIFPDKLQLYKHQRISHRGDKLAYKLIVKEKPSKVLESVKNYTLAIKAGTALPSIPSAEDEAEAAAALLSLQQADTPERNAAEALVSLSKNAKMTSQARAKVELENIRVDHTYAKNGEDACEQEASIYHGQLRFI